MSEIPESVRRQVWERDAYRCQECGLEVGRARGLMPQTHHRIPRSQGGSDEADNLITLCLPCHATKRGHTFMLPDVEIQLYPQFIKSALWDLSTNLMAYSDSYDPRHAPTASSVAQTISLLIRALESVLLQVDDCGRYGIGEGEIRLPRSFAEEQEQLERIIPGLRIVWQSHHMARALDRIIAYGERA